MSPGSTHPKTTVGVLSVNDVVFPYCMQALENQLGAPAFVTEIVRDVSPFNAAFDELVRRSNTEFMIQVDEDMILYPHAVARMQEVMEAAPDNIGMVLFYLFDPDRDQRIHGIKIFRTAVLRTLRSKDVKASEMDLLEQMLEAGYRWVIHPETMGYHGILYSPESIYRRYQTMYEKDISTWNVVTADMRRKALAFAESGDPNELFALLGSAHGVTGAQSFANKEKDFNTYDAPHLRVFRRLLLNTPAQHGAYDPSRTVPAFRNEPIPFDKVAWKSDRAALSSEEASLNRQDKMAPEAAISFDVRVVECMTREWLLAQVASNPSDPFLSLWVGLAHWYHRDFSEALKFLESARKLGAPAWRVSWYQALCLRDNRPAWSADARRECLSHIESVLQKYPQFEWGEVFRKYLASNDSLIEDFFACNSERSGQNLEVPVGGMASLLQARGQAKLDCLKLTLTSDSELEVFEQVNLAHFNAALIVVQAEEAFGAKLKASMLERGYSLWHADDLGCVFRNLLALPAPLFWSLRGALPLSPPGSKIEKKVEATSQPATTNVVSTALPPEFFRQIHQLVTLGRAQEAHRLVQQLTQQAPQWEELREVERRLSSLTRAAWRE
ncbi:MAG: hypothetical protein J0M12_00130 [Deltaproteobacteria bacterium]|nr:hypothetical protein [Deltaproteobacteria bacterium]